MEVPGCKSMFCFSGATGCAGELKVTERSCYECADCSQLKKSSCKNAPYTGPTHDTGVRLSNLPPVDPGVNAQHNELQSMLKNNVTANTNIVVRLQGGSYVLGKATKKPYRLEQGSGKSGEWIQKGAWVVEMYQYEDEGEEAAEASAEKSVLLGSEPCGEYLCDFGSTPPDLAPEGWEPCLKRHRALYRLRDVREPAGFVLPTSARGRATRQSKKRKATAHSLKYTVPAALQAQIQQNLNVVGAVLEQQATRPQRRKRK